LFNSLFQERVHYFAILNQINMPMKSGFKLILKMNQNKKISFLRSAILPTRL